MAKRRGKQPRPRSGGRQATGTYLRRVPRGAPLKRPVCIVTGKECFQDEDACWDWITESGRYGTCVPYRCFDCGWIHLTSNEVTVGRRMREREAEPQGNGVWSF